MPKLVKYLKQELPNWSSKQIVAAQEKALGKVYLSEVEFYNFRDEIFSLQEDLFGSSVFIKGQNFSLAFGK
jgi:ACT domain-containing protein